MTVCYLSGCLKAVWLEIFSPVFPVCLAEADPRDTPRSQGPTPHIKLHEKSAPHANSKAISRYPKNPARLPSGTQFSEKLRRLTRRPLRQPILHKQFKYEIRDAAAATLRPACRAGRRWRAREDHYRRQDGSVSSEPSPALCIRILLATRSFRLRRSTNASHDK